MRPSSCVPFRYLNILVTALQCIALGPLLNRDRNIVAYRMSGLVARAQYSRLPIADRYGWSVFGLSSWFSSSLGFASGFGAGVHLSRLTRLRNCPSLATLVVESVPS